MLFSLGKVVATSNALSLIDQADINIALARYMACDWGDLCEEDKAINDYAIKNGERILASYKSGKGVTFWIITEWDRSVTTVLLPEDY